MSQQPTGGAQDADPAFSQPQDPWSGFEPGLASMPTDPIPQQAYGPTVPGDIWSSPTVAHGSPPPPQFPYPPAPGRSNAAIITIVVVLVVVLGGGGAFGAYHYITTHPATGGSSPPTSASGPATAPAVFPYTAKVGDCVINVGTQARPRMAPSSCDAAGSYKIVRIARGASIPVGPDNTFDTDTTSARVCAGIDFDTWYGYQVDDPNLNLFFCMTNN